MSQSAILLSGGMDSYALTYHKRPDICITIDYGQLPARAEVKASKILVQRLNIPHEIVHVDLKKLGSGDLSKQAALDQAPASDWWPYRNQALITIAAMKLITMQVNELMIATVSSDSIHKDGSEEFINAINRVLSLQEGKMKLDAPAINLSTTQLIQLSEIPYSLLAWSHSCHTGNIACGQCRGCNKHREVVEELGYAEY